jgi:signal transduction histidine kinase/ligand-binding sensor domain-containing protein
MTTWTARDGLPSNYVLSIEQDADGYLWVGTFDGLVRFDGQRFTKWPATGEVPSPNPLVFATAHGRDGSLWVVFGGPSHVVRQTEGRITKYTAREGLPEGEMRSLLVRRDGTVWVGGAGGLASFRNGRWESLHNPFDGRNLNVSAIAEDDRHRLWVGTAGGVYRYADADRAFTRVDTGALKGAAEISARGQTIVMAGQGKVATLKTDGTGLRVASIADKVLQGSNPAFSDRRGQIWLGTNGAGLLRLQPDAREPFTLTARNGLGGDQIRAILEDRDGNIWVGTEAGLTRVSESRIRSAITRPDVTTENVTSLVADSLGHIWVNKSDGLARFTKDRDFSRPSSPWTQFGSISALFSNARGSTFIASTDGRVAEYANGAFHPVAPFTRGGDAVVGISAAHDNRLWLHDRRRFIRLGPSPSDHLAIDTPDQFEGRTFRFMYVDRRNRLWAGADGGLVAMLDGDRFRVYGQESGIPPGQLSGILEDREGRVWIGGDGGLSTFRDGRFLTLTTRNGLPSNRIFFTIPDATGDLWIGIGAGLVRMEFAELERALGDDAYRVRYLPVDSSDGLHGTPVMRGMPTASRSPDGTIWFATSAGVEYLNPSAFSATPPPPPVRVERVVANGRAFTPTNGLALPAGSSNLQIEYSALSLTAPGKTRFRHRLEGVDRNWIENGSSTQAGYANLAPRTYRFVLSASGGGGVWNDEAATWAFTITPAWHQTRTFFAALFLALALTGWAGWRFHAGQLRQRFELVLAERSRVGGEIHDTLLQSLVGMAMQLRNLSTQVAPLPSAQGELVRMQRQVEHYIEEAQQAIWDLRSSRLAPDDLHGTLRERGERITESTGVQFTFTTTGPPQKVAPRIQRQIVRIAQEAVVNAVRHGAPREVRVDLRYEERRVRVAVIDDGHGFATEIDGQHTRQHWGLSIMRERAEQIGGSLVVASLPNQGTRVELTAPVEV